MTRPCASGTCHSESPAIRASLGLATLLRPTLCGLHPTARATSAWRDRRCTYTPSRKASGQWRAWMAVRGSCALTWWAGAARTCASRAVRVASWPRLTCDSARQRCRCEARTPPACAASAVLRVPSSVRAASHGGWPAARLMASSSSGTCVWRHRMIPAQVFWQRFPPTRASPACAPACTAVASAAENTPIRVARARARMRAWRQGYRLRKPTATAAV
mmetsp:Transcript_7951/g.24409  ORF Transcript_7951/g.24409 Transcript_7951/m.24409 type:complete len:218 (+) Transcript_7951:460-1113(+)